MFEFVLVSIFVSLLVPNVHCNESTVRKTTNGPIEGIEEVSAMGQKYYAFRSIPFAEPPITGIDPYTGENVDRRFKAPEPLKRTWTENLKVHNARDACLIQSLVYPTEVSRSEDCLYLDVYVPAGGVPKKTVMIWIHGGGFTEGTYRDHVHGPDFVLSEDNIFVGINYRLGMFGFMDLGSSEYSGNMGLKDQQLALKWVYENIENFSGNKDEILLFGMSAGGAAAIHHMLNEESRKYFNRVFAGSGTPFSYFAIPIKGNHLERMMKCSNTNDQMTLIQYLKSAPSEDLVQCHFAQNWGLTIRPEWGPTIENEHAKIPFITQSADEMYNSGKAPAIDVLFSFTSQEQILFDPEIAVRTEPLITSNLEETSIRLPFDDLDKKTRPNEYKQALEKLRLAYFSNVTDANMMPQANTALMSDLSFRYSILKNVLLQIKANNNQKNVFLFRFGVHDAFNFVQYLFPHYDGAAHAEEYCYLFLCHGFDPYNLYEAHLMNEDSSAYNAIKRMMKMVTNFARTGNPSIEGDTTFKPCTSPSDIFCQTFDNNPKSSVITNIMEQSHYDVWREIERIYMQSPSK